MWVLFGNCNEGSICSEAVTMVLCGGCNVGSVRKLKRGLCTEAVTKYLLGSGFDKNSSEPQIVAR